MGIIFFVLFAALLIYPSTPVLAVPNENDNTSQTENSEDNTNNSNKSSTTAAPAEEDPEEQEEKAATNCANQIGALHWLVCPATDVISNFVDGIYNIILKNMLTIAPISTDSKSPIHAVWLYLRDITNLIFIIMILIVIFSYLTGIGINNYRIKQILPRLILTAILINLSFIVCLLAVDASNILGSSLNGTFDKVIEESFKNVDGLNISVSDVVAAIIGGGTLTIAGTALLISVTASSWTAIFFILITLLFGCALSLIAALLTLAVRQALVYLLVMVAPLAIVCYLLPNTESWFKKWRSTFFSMLIFYPMFSVLFGSCRLAGSVILSSATGPLTIILGIAIKILPLFMAIPMLRMSGTIPGRVSDMIHSRAVDPLNARVRNWGRAQGAAASARRAARATGRTRSPFTHLQNYLAQKQYEREEMTRSLQETAAYNRNEVLSAKKQGKRILGRREDGSLIVARTQARDRDGNLIFDNDGRPVYNSAVSDTKELQQEARRRNANFRAETEAAEVNQNLGQLGSYLNKNNIHNSELRNIASQNFETFKRSQTIAQAIRRDNKADARAYMDAVTEANRRDSSGQIIDQKAYHELITSGAGFDAYSDDASIREAALTSVVASAYYANERERKDNIENYQSYLNRQNSATVRTFMRNASTSSNTDAVVASMSILRDRGDHDAVQQEIKALFDGKFVDESGQPVTLNIDDDSTRAIAEQLLTFKSDPDLKRFGKHLLVEGAVYASEQAALNDPNNTTITSVDDMRARQVTFKEYATGYDANGRMTKKGGMVGVLQGTSLADVERTAVPNIMEAVDREYYRTGTDASGNAIYDDAAYRARQNAVFDALLPNLIGAVPSYTSGSEQINSAMNYVTGMKFDLKRGAKGEWKVDDSGIFTPEQLSHFRAMYIENQTPENLIGFKSDVIEAFKSFFGVEDNPDYIPGSNDENRKYAQRINKSKGQAALEIYFQNMFGDNPHDLSQAEISSEFGRRGINLTAAELSEMQTKLAINGHTKGQGTISKLLSGDPMALNRMKANIRQLLGIPNNLGN